MPPADIRPAVEVWSGGADEEADGHELTAEGMTGLRDLEQDREARAGGRRVASDGPDRTARPAGDPGDAADAAGPGITADGTDEGVDVGRG